MIPYISDIGVVYEFRVLARCCYFSIFAWSLKMKRDDLHSRMETLKRHLLFSGQEGLQELKKIVIRLEEKIYTTATNQVFA